MIFVMDSALNKAHLEYRRAEALLGSKKFVDAIKCHEKAATLLYEALDGTENLRSLESMKLQREFHIRQKDIIMMQKKQYDLRSSESNRSKNLPEAIHDTLEKTDLLLVLLREGGEGNLESLKSMTPTVDGNMVQCADSDDNAITIALKHSKDKYVVVEELVTLNEQLRAHVYTLVEQLETKEREVGLLKERLATLELHTAATPPGNGGNNNEHNRSDTCDGLKEPEEPSSVQQHQRHHNDTDRSAQ